MPEETRLLIVDDDSDFCAYVENRASVMDVHSDSVISIAEAKVIAKEKEYSAFIIDGNLPDGQGVELVSWVQQEFGKEVLTAFVSAGYAGAKDFRTLKHELGVDYVLNKPVNVTELDQLLNFLNPTKDDLELEDDFLADIKQTK